jgi:predicted O-methyltransferase YrrM
MRYAIKYEFKKQNKNSLDQMIKKILDTQSQDITKILQHKATKATADYVEEHMKNIDSVSSNLELLTLAMKKSDLGNNRLLCEFGVYSGQTINHIASHTNQTIYGFDSFEGLPERWREGFKKEHFKISTLPKVRSNVILIKGWFNETLPNFIKDHKELLGFLHIDCDLYSSTKTIFELLEHQIQPGCVIVFDEYFNYPGWEEGEYKAFQEFIKRTGLKYEYISYNSLHEQVAVKITSK